MKFEKANKILLLSTVKHNGQKGVSDKDLKEAVNTFNVSYARVVCDDCVHADVCNPRRYIKKAITACACYERAKE